MKVSLLSTARTHIGLVRKTNEDSCFADDRRGIYVLADGIGGRPGGAQASTIAVHSVVTELGASSSEQILANKSCLLAAFNAAHEAVARENMHIPEARRMGTTLSVVVIAETHFVVGNVGDSRIYLAMPDSQTTSVSQLSRDHTIASELGLHDGRAEFHPHNALTQAVGIGRDVVPHVAYGSVAVNDAIVLCSDGISDYAGDASVKSILLNFSKNPHRMADALIRTSLANGGGDNCTCICISVCDVGS